MFRCRGSFTEALRDEGGKVRLKQALPLKTLGMAQGATWGMLWGTLADYGINDQFIKEVGATLTPDSSALFVLLRRVSAEKVLPEVAKYNPKILRTSLTSEQEAKLRAALEQSTRERKAT